MKRLPASLLIILLFVAPRFTQASGPPTLELTNQLSAEIQVKVEGLSVWHTFPPKSVGSLMLDYGGDTRVHFRLGNGRVITEQISPDDIDRHRDWTKWRLVRGEIGEEGFRLLPAPAPAWYNPGKVSPALADLALWTMLAWLGFGLTTTSIVSSFLKRLRERRKADSLPFRHWIELAEPGRLSLDLRAAITSAALVAYLAPKIPSPGCFIFALVSAPLGWLAARSVIPDLTRLHSQGRPAA